ncbi:Hsp20/alpha crystallin family protein [Edaphobacter sp. HDX4]|uniref:Hsp20/alpha crystallin family protein n=1 Tax=Edaphobacter sp. HDX4 TaxID=2794064 RepID=UPI002FE62F6E
MATENEQSTQPTGKEEDRSSQKPGLIRNSQDGGVARRPGSGLALTPYEMLLMNPFSFFRRMTEGVLQPFSEDEASPAIAWLPRVEIFERDGKYHVLAELPGLSPKDVRVEADDGALVIQGERKVEQDATEGGVRRSERQFGYFFRRIPLPQGVDPEQAKAKFQDGVLEIIMPAPSPKVERKQIPVEGDSKSASDQSKQAA